MEDGDFGLAMLVAMVAHTVGKAQVLLTEAMVTEEGLYKTQPTLPPILAPPEGGLTEGHKESHVSYPGVYLSGRMRTPVAKQLTLGPVRGESRGTHHATFGSTGQGRNP